MIYLCDLGFIANHQSFYLGLTLFHVLISIFLNLLQESIHTDFLLFSEGFQS